MFLGTRNWDLLKDILVCPACKKEISVTGDNISCKTCGNAYPVVDGIPVLLGPMEVPTFYKNAAYEKLLSTLGQLHDDYYNKSLGSGLEDFIRRRLLKLVKHATPPVLDFGCGTGSAFHVLEKFDGLIGIDINLELLKVSRANFPKTPLICCDFTNAPLRPGSIKTIFSLGTLEHIFHLERSIESIERCLAADGVLYVMVPNEGSLPWSLMRAFYTAPRYSRMFALNYHEAMSRSHCNNIWAIENALFKYFEFDAISRFPLGYGGKGANLFSFYRLRKRVQS